MFDYILINGSSVDEITKHTDIKLKKRSVVILTDDARYKWTHEINKAKNKNFGNIDPRISLTLRKCIL
jgi:alkylated DNA repair dioxygenase AlkB